MSTETVITATIDGMSFTRVDVENWEYTRATAVLKKDGPLVGPSRP